MRSGAPSATVSVRPATLDDVADIRVVLAAHDNDGPVTTADIAGPYVRHVVRTGRAYVATEGDRVVGYGATVDAGVAVHLADLFVLPDRLDRGLGRRLLDAVFAGARRRTTFASGDPRAMRLYVAAGMAPWWPNLSLEGASAAVPPSSATSCEARDPARLAALELAWNGFDRSADHAFWSSQAGADSFVVITHDEPVAIAHARAPQASGSRAVDRLLVRPGADPVPPILAALRRAGRGGPVVASVQGPSPALPVLLDLGFRIVDRDTYMASEPGLVDPARLIPNAGML